MVFDEEETHHPLQTVNGCWHNFGVRTRMMKGLFNYETAFREYFRLLLQDFLDDNIQYAEIRPTFMKANYLWTDDGTDTIDNAGIMEIMQEEYSRFLARQEEEEKPRYFGGIKVIYCFPRSFSETLVAGALAECLEFKLRWPDWIAGFDLVGQEDKGKPLQAFDRQIMQFKHDCREAGVDIPLLFHCGETLEKGTENDGNLATALSLGVKRIGHGYAAIWHPEVLRLLRELNICVESCPISNEILKLGDQDHLAITVLEANGVKCSISSDNGTIFSSTLSHDFYYVLMSSNRFSLHTMRAFIECSLDCSCMSEQQKERVIREWKKLWDSFVSWIIETFGQEKELSASK